MCRWPLAAVADVKADDVAAHAWRELLEQMYATGKAGVPQLVERLLAVGGSISTLRGILQGCIQTTHWAHDDVPAQPGQEGRAPAGIAAAAALASRRRPFGIESFFICPLLDSVLPQIAIVGALLYAIVAQADVMAPRRRRSTQASGRATYSVWSAAGSLTSERER